MLHFDGDLGAAHLLRGLVRDRLERGRSTSANYVKTGPGGSWDFEAVSASFLKPRLKPSAGLLDWVACPEMTATTPLEHLGGFRTAEAADAGNAAKP